MRVSDADGILSFFELNHFYEEQMHRMECLSQEVRKGEKIHRDQKGKRKIPTTVQQVVSFEDILCQLVDMVKPNNEIAIKKKDIRNSKLGGNFFNVLFNLNKFIQVKFVLFFVCW